MVLRTLIAFAVAVALLVAAFVRYRTRRSPPARLVLLATCCFLIVSFAHIFEAFGLLPAAGWGQPHSIGHYVDLSAALLGLVLLGGAVVLPVHKWARRRR